MDTQKILKHYCKYVYVAGAGNYWYDDTYTETVPYKVYTYVSFAIYTVMILLENMAALFGSFPDVEKNSAVMFAAIHDIVLYKMYTMLLSKGSIKELNREMAAVGASREEGRVMRRQRFKLKWGMVVYVVSVYLSLIAYGVESFRRMYQEGV
ncbi:hypothetical protein EVAR_81356_1 [Eumeta japonica]|uniref:Uncharacterized protein n=1 Tax=Eumeta variegata TaxID=151549 RepID=A0A4C1XAU4_EUMVA|nr:hypothetical protein EVAR_81356_1 [Eumeta japonica]